MRGEDRRRNSRQSEPKVHFMLHSCHVGIKGSDLTAESTNLEVLMLWNRFEAVKHHVKVLCRLWICLIRLYT